VVLLPIYRSDDERAQVLPYCDRLQRELEAQSYGDGKLQVLLDDRDLRGGEKNWQHVKRGVPLRAEIGPKDIAKHSVFLARRDTGQKGAVPRDEFVGTVCSVLDEIQNNLLQKALALREENTREIRSLAEFRDYFTPRNAEKPEIHGGFAVCHWCEDPAADEALKELKVTIRCVTLQGEQESGECVFTGKPSKQKAVFAKAY
jgi:prolyl-tRNA synthetase